MSFHSGGSHLETNGYWHARLMCKLSAEVTKQELKTLKQVIRSSGMAPKNSIAESEDFFALWDVLERQDLIKPGEYSFLRDNFEMLNRKDLAAMIKAHCMEVEEFRRTQIRKIARSSVDTVDEKDDPLLNDFELVDTVTVDEGDDPLLNDFVVVHLTAK